MSDLRIFALRPPVRFRRKKFLRKVLTKRQVRDIIFGSEKYDPLAQSVEHLTFNQGVRDSSSRWVTKREGIAFAVPSLLTIHDGIEAFKLPASYKYIICNVRLDPSEARRSSFPMDHQKRRHRFCAAFSVLKIVIISRTHSTHGFPFPSPSSTFYEILQITPLNVLQNPNFYAIIV